MRLSGTFIFLLGFGLVLLQAQNVVSNEKMIEKLFFQALDSLKIEWVGPELSFRFESLNDEQKAFCKSRLIKYFNEKQSKSHSKTQILVIQEFKPQVDYFESVGQLFGLGKMVRREISLKLSAYLDGAQPLSKKKFVQLELKKQDLINRSKIQYIEQSPFTFTHGKWVSFSRWTRFLQPAIIVGSVSILIYLFYSLRT